MNQDSSGTGLEKHTMSQNVSDFSYSTGIAECKKSRYPLTQNLMQNRDSFDYPDIRHKCMTIPVDSKPLPKPAV
jgi:hypothetical protein